MEAAEELEMGVVSGIKQKTLKLANVCGIECRNFKLCIVIHLIFFIFMIPQQYNFIDVYQFLTIL